MHVSDNIETENARVEFLSSIAQAMAAKARIVLKTKSLYAADGRAVKELLKLAKTLNTCVSRRLSVAQHPVCARLPRYSD